MGKTRDESVDFIAQIAEAGLTQDVSRLEVLLLTAVRKSKKRNPGLSKELTELLGKYSANKSGLRWAENPPPSDEKEGVALVKIESTNGAEAPIVCDSTNERIRQFVSERQNAAKLIQEGFVPPRTLLLTGPPGTGKTMLAKWIAKQLSLPFVVQDLATSVSSFLGKTGFNLKRSLDYARNSSCLFLLDEIDAIAKRRDDVSDVGELKRVVNVLLKEIEAWPLNSVLVGATNHPELLDPAIRRRFDVSMDLAMPGTQERIEIMGRVGGRFLGGVSSEFTNAFSFVLEGSSGSDIENLVNAAIRKHLISGLSVENALVQELKDRHPEMMDSSNIGSVIRAFRSASGDTFTVRQLAGIFGKSASTIQHHISKGK